MTMISEKDLESMGYYEMFETRTQNPDAYSEWVEGKILTESSGKFISFRGKTHGSKIH